MTLQYDFIADYWSGMILHLLVALVCVAAVGLLIYFYFSKKWQKGDDHSQSEDLPLWRKLLNLVVVILVVSPIFIFGFSGFVELAIFAFDCAQENYSEIQGTVANVELEYQDEALYNVRFQIGDTEFQDLYNIFPPKDIRCIQDGQRLCVPYGRINGQLTIYRIYTIDAAD